MTLNKIHRKLSVFLAMATVLSAQGAGTTTTSSASSGLVKSSDYALPTYTNTQFPAITSCDVKSGEEDAAVTATGTNTGNGMVDMATGTASLIQKSFQKNKELADGIEDTPDVEKGVSMNQNCGQPTQMNLDGKSAEKMACSRFDDADFIKSLADSNNAAKKILACQRGVLAAINGELTCFKKQITQAQSFMNELINNQGGLNQMLTSGVSQMTAIDQEVSDRQAQLKELTRRLEDPKTGMGAAKEALDKLDSDIPVQQDGITKAIQQTKDQQTRYNTLIQQVTMGRTLDCLKRQAPGYRCVQDGSTSTKYPMGNVSPLDYMKCIYAQRANQVAGGNVVKNTALEDSRISQVDSTVKGLNMPTMTDLPAFDDKTGYAGAMKSYTIKTPQDLINAFASITSAADQATGKSVTAQFSADVTACYNQANTQTANDRKDPNTNVGVGASMLAQMAKSQAASYASQMRKLKSTYENAVKSATGQSVQLNTTHCENDTLDNQSKCLDAIGALVDAVLTGNAATAQAKLNDPATSALTNGQPPISGFISSLAAPSDKTRQITAQNPARTISNINCTGLTACVAAYENLKVELENTVQERQQKKESMKSEINNAIVQTAQSIASGKNAQGVQSGTLSLNQVSKSLSDRKEQLIQAMKNLKVGGSLDLDPEKIGDMDVDEKTGLYKASSLRNVVLSSIDPKMLSNDEKGFASASKDIQKRDDDLEDKENKLDDYVDKIIARKDECAKDAKKSNCEKVTNYQTTFCKTASDQAAKLIEGYLDQAKTATATKNTDLAKYYTDLAQKLSKENVTPSQTGETNGDGGSLSSALNCGTAPSYYKQYCGLGDSVSDNSIKDFNTGTGKGKTGGRKSGGL